VASNQGPTLFQPVTDPSVPAITKTVGVTLRSYFLTTVRETKLNNTNEIHEAVRGLKVSKVPGANGIPNRALKHLPQRALSLQSRIFNAVPRSHHSSEMCKHTRVISILKPGYDPTLHSSDRPISLFKTPGEVYEKSY
jgi:hypothetical protein